MNDGSDRDVIVFTDALRLPAGERDGYPAKLRDSIARLFSPYL